jgi:hypothetical protein
VLIKTNDPEFVKQIRKVLSIISQLRSEDGSISSSIAMPLVGIMEIGLLQETLAVAETGISFLRALSTRSTDVMDLKEK